MAPIAAVPGFAGMDQKQFLSELSGIQKALFDYASNYTKLVLGVGYAGFFGAWAGTRSNLRPTEVVASALLVCLSLLAYVAHEVAQARAMSRAAFALANMLNAPEPAMSAIEQYKKTTNNIRQQFSKWWRWVFDFCATTGILGTLILIGAFIRSLMKMIWH